MTAELLLKFFVAFQIQLSLMALEPSNVGHELVIDHFDHMERIDYGDGVGKVFVDVVDIWLIHIRISETRYLTLALSPAGIDEKYGSVISCLLLARISTGSPVSKSWSTRAYLHTRETFTQTLSTQRTSGICLLGMSTYLANRLIA